MYNYGRSKNYEECGCCKKMSYPNWKNDDQLDDIKDLLKKILEEKKDNKKDDKKDDKKDHHHHHHQSCEVASVSFEVTGQTVIFPTSGTLFGCPITPGILIDELLQCLYNRGFRIQAFIATNGIGVYTLVRCR